jgi:hypothetical protein
MVLTWSSCAAVIAMSVSSLRAQDGSARALFERHGLLGTFAWDCSSPVARNNLYFVHRALDGGRVQRDQMSGPTTRDFVLIWEHGVEAGPNEVALRGSRDGKPVQSVYRAEAGRMRVLEGTVAGVREVSGGRLVRTGREMPWVSKCSGPPPQQSQPVPPAARADSAKALFERHDLITTFAVECSKPAAPNNLYYVNRALDEQRVQRDQMSGPTKRDFVIILDHGEDRGPNAIFASGTLDNQPFEATWLVAAGRMRGMESKIGGRVRISGGRLVGSGVETSWLHRCG